MSGQSVNYIRNVTIGTHKITYIISDQLVDEIHLATDAIAKLLPGKITGKPEQDVAELEKDIALLRQGIIQNGAPDSLKGVFNTFNSSNPFIRDKALKRTAFADFVGDIANGKWKEHREEFWRDKKKSTRRSHD